MNVLSEQARLFKRLLVHRSPLMPTGLLRFCLSYAKKSTEPLSGIFTVVRNTFSNLASTTLEDQLGEVYEFRNTYIAHQKAELTDAAETRKALHVWISALARLSDARGPKTG